MRRLRAGLLAVLLVTASSGGTSWSLCGPAINFADTVQGTVRVRRVRISGDTLDARLVCPHPKRLCNGRVGHIHGTLSPADGGTTRSLAGTLVYGQRLDHRLVCGLHCQVNGVVGGPRAAYYCQFSCPAGSAVRHVSFTVLRRCP